MAVLEDSGGFTYKLKCKRLQSTTDSQVGLGFSRNSEQGPSGKHVSDLQPLAPGKHVSVFCFWCS